MNEATILALINAGGTALPLLIDLVKLLMNSDPNTTAGELQAQAQLILDANAKLVADWMEKNPE